MICDCGVKPVKEGYEIYCPICFLHLERKEYKYYNINELKRPDNYIHDLDYEEEGREEIIKLVKQKKSDRQKNNKREHEKYSKFAPNY